VSLLDDPRALVPAADPGLPGDFARFRAACSRFVNGPEHTRRRRWLVHRLDRLDLATLDATGFGDHDPDPEFLPVAVLARALGFAEPAELPALVAEIAAAYPTGAGAPDRATREALARAPREEPVLHLQLLVQAFAATAALARGVEPPVPSTRRVLDGELVTVALDGIPFGQGPRRCPAEPVARRLAAMVRP
jgi:hypothetical protein